MAAGLRRRLARRFVAVAGAGLAGIGLVGTGLVAAGTDARAEVVAANTAPQLKLTLAQALAIGLRNSLALRSRALFVQENRALQGLARTRFLPKLDLVGLGSYGQVGTSIGFISNLNSIGDLNFNLSGDGYAVVQNTFANAGLALNLPLLDFARGPLQQAARFGVQAAEAEQSEQQRLSRFEIESAYSNAQLADAQVPVWERSLLLSSTVLRDARAIRRQGLAARIDTLQAEALVQTDRQGLDEALAQRRIALSALARTLNLPPEQQLSVEDPLRMAAPWPLGLDQSLQRALEQRPSLEALQRQRQALLAQVQVARASRLPSLGLLLGGGINGDWLATPVLTSSGQLGVNGASATLPGVSASGTASGSFYDWGGVLSLRQPLFDGGLSRESTALAQRRADQGQLAIEQARQAITQNVQTWYASHQAAGPQIQAATAASRAGDEAVRDALLRYRAGIAPLTELLLAQRNLQLASSARAAAIYRWNLSRAALVMETGLGEPQADSAAAAAGGLR